MKYTVIISRASQKVINRFDGDMHARIIRKLETIEDNPRPVGIEKLAGPDNLYRVRVGDWRIVYAIQDRNLVVLVVKVAHRREVYR
jgi:mRNA interferase RelE/StbE